MNVLSSLVLAYRSYKNVHTTGVDETRTATEIVEYYSYYEVATYILDQWNHACIIYEIYSA